MNAGGKEAAKRYLPYVAILALQLALLGQQPTKKVIVSGGAGATAAESAAASADQTSVASEVGPAVRESTSAAGPSSANPSGNASSAPQSSARTGAASGATTGAGSATAAVGAAGGGQQVDSLGRPITGDKSKCAPGGLVQENVSFTGRPCTPKLEGPNGGATNQGVTADTITMLVVIPSYGETVDRSLAATGLAETPQQATEDAATYTAFFNKHFEFYGRKLKMVTEHWQVGDPASQRAQAKAYVAKHRPFVIGWAHIGGTPIAFADQVAQLGVMMIGGPSVADNWYKQHAPYVWDSNPQGERVADMVADYYCKKMWGKNATLAGDPTMRLKRRKLGILSSEDPAYLFIANRMKEQVSGGMCGSPDDGTTIYTYSTDAATAQNQAPTLVTRMKNDGVTTKVSASGGVPGTQEDDRQQYQPENILSGVASADLDTVGRLYQALSSPQQMQNTFGVGFQGASHPVKEHEYYRAAKDVNPQAEPPYISWGIYIAGNLASHLIQAAGPTLTPQNAEKGMRTTPQIAGYVNPQPWPGWKCCNPHAPEWNFTKANSYTAWYDAREVYWSSSAISPEDNQPGAWQCVDQCKRYEAGQWPKGEPKQPT